MFTIRYLLLRREAGGLLLWRDAVTLVLVVAGYFLILKLIPTINFFGPNGIVDRTGSLTSTLTGFYVAALVAAATFASSHAGLDDEIESGRIYQNMIIDEVLTPDYLTRREYVCAIFGYVSFLALFISILSILLVSISGAVPIPQASESWIYFGFLCAKYAVGCGYCLAVAHMLATTTHGLYYLSYRLYLGDGAAVDVQLDTSPIGKEHVKLEAAENVEIEPK